MPNVLVNDPKGNPTLLPEEEAPNAFQKLGYTPATSEQSAAYNQELSANEQYGEGLAPLKAAALGAAETLTLGTSNQLLTRSGMVNPETIKELEERNPISHFAGAAAPLVIAPELGAPGLVSGAGRVAAGVAGKVLPAASSTIGKILASTATEAAGSAVEGALYGTGALISDQALGDHELNAENVMGHVGYGAILGGALGSVFGAAKGALSKEPTIMQQIEKERGPVDPQDSFQAALNSSAVDPHQKEMILNGLSKLKPNEGEIKKAAMDIGAPVLEGQISASKHVQDLESYLLSQPSPEGVSRQQLYQRGFDAVDRTLGDALATGEDLSKIETGNALKTSLTQKIESELQPTQRLYDEIKQSYKNIDLNLMDLKSTARDIVNMEEATLSKSSPIAKLANRVAEDLPNLKNLDEVKRYKTMIREELSPTASPAEKSAVYKISDKLSELEENSISAKAEELYNATFDPNAKQKILDLMEQRRAANVNYKSLKETISGLGIALGKKIARGTPGDFLDAIEQMPPEQITQKLFTKNNAEFLDAFKTKFPEEAKVLMDYQKSILREKSTVDGVIQSGKVLREVNKMSPEIKQLLFSPQELQKIEAVNTWMEALPKNINPSGTSKAESYGRFFSLALPGAVLAQAKDYGISKLITAATRGQLENNPILAPLLKMEKMINKASNSSEGLIRSMLKAGTEVIERRKPLFFLPLMNYDEKYDDFKKIEKRLVDATSTPERYVDTVHQATEHISKAAPNIASGMQNSLVRATDFLKSKLPDTTKPSLFSPEIKPSDAEINKFYRYYAVVENPVIALEQIRDGTLVPETIETLQNVYPKLYTDMQTKILDKVTDIKDPSKLHYTTKVMLSMFLGQDLIQGLTQKNIMMNQMAIRAPSKQQDNQPIGAPQRGTEGGMKKLSIAERIQTPLRETETRT